MRGPPEAKEFTESTPCTIPRQCYRRVWPTDGLCSLVEGTHRYQICFYNLADVLYVEGY